MSMETLDALRGWAIATLIITLVVLGLSRHVSKTKYKVKLVVSGVAGIIGGVSGLVVFFLFNFIKGWDEYFATKASGEHVEYEGRHQLAAAVIKTLGEMEVSSVGVIFGVVGLILFGVGVVCFLQLRKNPSKTLTQ